MIRNTLAVIGGVAVLLPLVSAINWLFNYQVDTIDGADLLAVILICLLVLGFIRLGKELFEKES